MGLTLRVHTDLEGHPGTERPANVRSCSFLPNVNKIVTLLNVG